ncbi:MAG: mechanosensitive ion channel family protein [Candidatus Paceibacterota bacterium]
MNETNNVAEVLQGSMADLWGVFILHIPVIVAALLVLILGLILAPLLGNIARRVVNLTNADRLAEQAGLAEELKKIGLQFTISGLVGGLVKWFFLLVFFVATVDILGWDRLTDVLYELLFFVPDLIVAVVILTVGLIVGNLLDRMIVKKIELSKVSISHGPLIGAFAKWSIIVFATLTALYQLGVAQELIIILFAGLVLTFSLAFGLGGRQKAAEVIERLDKSK